MSFDLRAQIREYRTLKTYLLPFGFLVVLETSRKLVEKPIESINGSAHS